MKVTLGSKTIRLSLHQEWSVKFGFLVLRILYVTSVFSFNMDETILKRLTGVVLHETETDSTLVEDHDLNDGLKEDDLSIFVHMYGGNIFILKGLR